MCEICIPVMSGNWNEHKKAALIQELKRISPTLVYLIYMRETGDREKAKQKIEIFKNNKDFLETHGFCVGAWFAPTIGYGGLAKETDVFPFQPIMTMKGERTKSAFCPLDDKFCDDLAFQFTEIAKTGVKRILLEDDFTLSGGKYFVQDMGCCCPLHLKALSARLGKNVQSGEDLRRFLTEGKPNAVRTAFLDLMSETLKKMAHVVEKAVHSVDETIRIGLSANSASYHIEGADFFELTKIVAGKNKPFMRITGAPYWKNGPSLASMIEMSRMQNVWCKEREVDAMSEGDTFPRPAFLVPSAHLEMFDMILRADGNEVGILKYMLDYTANADYETAYTDSHVANEAIYQEIERRFTGDTIGLSVLEQPLRISEMEFDDVMSFYNFHSHATLPLLSQWFVTDNCLPTTYSSIDGATLVFGESARLVNEKHLKHGLILDAKAAKILHEQGIDVGFDSITPYPTLSGEYFPEYNDCTLVSVEGKDGFFHFNLKPNTKVISYFYNSGANLGVVESYKNGDERIPGCYLYENKQGQRFMVYTFGAHKVKSLSEWRHGVFRNYYRQQQIIKGYEWLCGKPLPATLEKHPNAYLLCRKNGKAMHVGLWNISPDPIFNPVITLDKPYRLESIFGAEGVLDGRTLHLKNTVAPYSCVFFTVEE